MSCLTTPGVGRPGDGAVARAVDRGEGGGISIAVQTRSSGWEGRSGTNRLEGSWGSRLAASVRPGDRHSRGATRDAPLNSALPGRTCPSVGPAPIPSLTQPPTALPKHASVPRHQRQDAGHARLPPVERNTNCDAARGPEQNVQASALTATGLTKSPNLLGFGVWKNGDNGGNGEKWGEMGGDRRKWGEMGGDRRKWG